MSMPKIYIGQEASTKNLSLEIWITTCNVEMNHFILVFNIKVGVINLIQSWWSVSASNTSKSYDIPIMRYVELFLQLKWMIIIFHCRKVIRPDLIYIKIQTTEAGPPSGKLLGYWGVQGSTRIFTNLKKLSTVSNLGLNHGGYDKSIWCVNVMFWCFELRNGLKIFWLICGKFLHQLFSQFSDNCY